MKKILFIFVFHLSGHLSAQEPIDQYLAIAAENNPGLKATFSEYQAALEQIPQARSLPDPQLTLGAFIRSVETRVGPQRATLALSQSFPWFGTLKAQGDVAATMAETKFIAFQDEKSRLYKEVRLAYNRLYFLNKSIVLTEDNLQLLASFKELARVNFESGQTGFVNVLRVEMEEQELTTKLAFLNDSRLTAMKEFENLLNSKLQEAIDFPDSLTALDLPAGKEVLYDSIINVNRRLKSLDSQASTQESQLEVAKLMARPSFMVGASYINLGERTDMDVPGNGKDAFIFPQVGLRIPLYQKRYQAMEKQARLQKESILYRKENEVNIISSQLENLMRDYQDAQRRMALYRDLYELAERSVSLLLTEFTTGKSDFEELIRMERKMLNFQLEFVKARVEINNAVYNIDYLMGRS